MYNGRTEPRMVPKGDLLGMKMYVAPKSVVLSVNMSENIAISEVSMNGRFGVINGKIQNTPFTYEPEGDYLINFFKSMMDWKEGDEYTEELYDYYFESAFTTCWRGGSLN